MDNKVLEVRREISKYINKNRLIKVTVFIDKNYYGTIIFNKKLKLLGCSKLNKSDKIFDKSIGTMYSMYRYLDGLVPNEEEKALISLIRKNIPRGYKKYLTNINPLDDIFASILSKSKYFKSGYNRVDITNSIVKYSLMDINGLNASITSQDITKIRT